MTFRAQHWAAIEVELINRSKVVHLTPTVAPSSIETKSSGLESARSTYVDSMKSFLKLVADPAQKNTAKKLVDYIQAAEQTYQAARLVELAKIPKENKKERFAFFRKEIKTVDTMLAPDQSVFAKARIEKAKKKLDADKSGSSLWLTLASGSWIVAASPVGLANYMGNKSYEILKAKFLEFGKKDSDKKPDDKKSDALAKFKDKPGAAPKAPAVPDAPKPKTADEASLEAKKTADAKKKKELLEKAYDGTLEGKRLEDWNFAKKSPVDMFMHPENHVWKNIGAKDDKVTVDADYLEPEKFLQKKLVKAYDKLVSEGFDFKSDMTLESFLDMAIEKDLLKDENASARSQA